MAHLIKLNKLDTNHEFTGNTVPILFNLDAALGIESSINGKYSLIFSRWGHLDGIKVKESLDEILKLSKDNKKSFLTD
jgi:hypothetical protein